jgi:hypothetical protein
MSGGHGFWNAAGGGASNLDDLTDVDTTTTPPTAGQVLAYDDVSGLWLPATISTGDGSGGGYAATSVLVADNPPATAQSINDEFDDASIDAKWSNVYAGIAPTWTERADGMLYLSMAAEGGWNLKSLLQSVPSGDWAVTCMLGPYTAPNQNYVKPGLLILAEGGATQGVYLFGRMWPASMSIRVERLNSFTSFNGVPNSNGTATSLGVNWPLYLRITKASTTYSFEVSGDGTTWMTIWSSTLAFTPTKIGLGGNVENTVHGCGGTFGWFRQTA